eukprot:COSAG02_NODE_5876_length_3970_cov_3.517696_1_plen_60_part_00
MLSQLHDCTSLEIQILTKHNNERHQWSDIKLIFYLLVLILVNLLLVIAAAACFEGNAPT